jgi:hypothetical protein
VQTFHWSKSSIIETDCLQTTPSNLM